MGTIRDFSCLGKRTSRITAPIAWRQRPDAGLADGYFIAPYTVGDYLATTSLPA